jgi:hypothetical protein
MAKPAIPRPTPHGTPNRGGMPTPPAPPPPPAAVDPFAKGADGLYAGRNGMRTSLPQPMVDMLAPTNPMMPASFGQFIGPGLPLGHPIKPGAPLDPNPTPLGPGVPPLPATPGKGKKKKKAQAAVASNPFA